MSRIGFGLWSLHILPVPAGLKIPVHFHLSFHSAGHILCSIIPLKRQEQHMDSQEVLELEDVRPFRYQPATATCVSRSWSFYVF